jgi:hypothetical protein
VAELGATEVEWGVFSLEISNHGADDEPLDPATLRGAGVLRTALLVGERHGNEAMGAFYSAFGARYFEGCEPFDAATAEAALVDVGLDPGLRAEALADGSTWTRLEAEHAATVAATAGFGVPTIERRDVGGSMFGPVISEVPDDDESLALFDHVVWLIARPNVAELKRGARSVPLDLERARQWARKSDS